MLGPLVVAELRSCSWFVGDITTIVHIIMVKFLWIGLETLFDLRVLDDNLWHSVACQRLNRTSKVCSRQTVCDPNASRDYQGPNAESQALRFELHFLYLFQNDFKGVCC